MCNVDVRYAHASLSLNRIAECTSSLWPEKLEKLEKPVTSKKTGLAKGLWDVLGSFAECH